MMMCSVALVQIGEVLMQGWSNSMQASFNSVKINSPKRGNPNTKYKWLLISCHKPTRTKSKDHTFLNPKVASKD